MLVRNKWHKFKHFIKDHKLDYLLVFIVVLLAMAWLQAGPNFLDSQSFYHAKMVESVNNSLILGEFNWLQSTYFAEGFADNNWLYHYILSLFINLLPTFLVLKLFGVLTAALLATYIYYWIKKHKGKWPLLFVALLFSSTVFIKDLNILGAQALSLILLLFSVDLIINYKYWQLGLLSIVLTLLSGSFWFVVLLTIGWIFIEFVYNKWNLDKFRTRFANWRQFILTKLGLLNSVSRKKWLLLLFSLVGVLIGIIIHPYWPDNIIFYGQQMVNKMNFHSLSDFLGLLWSAKSIFLLFVTGLLAVPIKKQAVSKLSLYLIIGAVITCYFYLTAGWGAGMFIILTCLSASLLWRDATSQARNLFARWRFVRFFQNNKLSAIGLVLLLVIVISPYYSIYTNSKKAYPLDYMQAAGYWLYYHAPDNALVLNSDWQDWAPLYYYNDNNYYWWGLDPKLSYNRYYSSIEDMVDIIEGRVSKNVYAFFKDKMKADYILVNNNKTALIEQFNSNIYFDFVYKDKDAWVYKIQ